MSEGKQVLVQGRIVWTAGSDPFKGQQKKDQQGRLVFDDKGQPAMQYGYGLAVPKPGPSSTPDEVKNFMDIWNAIQSEAMALFPSGRTPPDFSFKYKDGDGIDHKGNPFNVRTGYAGCLVFALTTSLPLKFFKYNGAYQEVKDGIKCGDYVQVQVNVKGHTPKPNTQGKPGLYLNPNLTLFLGFGEEIVNTPEASSVFGAAPPPLPNGASATPVGGAPNFANFGQQPAMPQAPAAPQVPQWNGQANPAVLPPQFQQPAQQQYQMPAVPQQQMGNVPASFVPQQPMQQPVSNMMGSQPASNVYPSNGVPQMGNGSIPTPGFVPPVQQQNMPFPGQAVPQPANNAFPSNGGAPRPPWQQ